MHIIDVNQGTATIAWNVGCKRINASDQSISIGTKAMIIILTMAAIPHIAASM